ncbi:MULTISPECIES: hypothetical protein [Streptomyces]|uniref:hypothetical protein n=1 Tax=Streptomyces TaxID=1883 RepID=UPI0016731135|nr:MULTISPECIES: hypothetical protein [Streptomyces]MBD3575014.1 hypothetical protein [Streptomyces sp. KD18]GGT23978.1 hypothetical protein GCM10010286_56730 [Streptomyces toxytricini]
MPQTASTPSVCRDCDGFATVTITTGDRSTDGTRATIRVYCPACRGLGNTAPANLARIGR